MKPNTSTEAFTNSLDDYLKHGKMPSGTEKHDPEVADLLELGKKLSEIDFEARAYKEQIRKVVFTADAASDSATIWQKGWFKGAITAAAVFLFVGVMFSPPAIAGEWMGKIIKTLSLGYIEIQQVEPENIPVPYELQGKIFDEHGNALTKMSVSDQKVYTADGEEIAGVRDGVIITKQDAERDLNEIGMTTIHDAAKLNDHTNFEVKVPAYLPEGYQFERAEQYNNDDGLPAPEYINLYYRNTQGQELKLFQREASEETAYGLSTESRVEEIKINGQPAALIGDSSIDWQSDGVLYSLAADKTGQSLSKEELIKIAESIK
ncbi:hypothetical protein J41TS12_41250 [Paenibacillus antibioticophila]|uniref:DUF4367 domain-containing protein n=1 Tax=Paenibacillus antibioticophila TaxID=1274374 RepID=A0A920CJC6_9BACL|nr:DUF4367 domain-containing protein [Paenibacillus antibioticophila]GIO39264.1 hypothetical protein J41TS12_41250 [Paenibacillus antibioticophila]